MGDVRKLIEALQLAFLAGFEISGEGWNGEYPFSDHKETPLDDEHFLERRDVAVAAILRAMEARNG